MCLLYSVLLFPEIPSSVWKLQADARALPISVGVRGFKPQPSNQLSNICLLYTIALFWKFRTIGKFGHHNRTLILSSFGFAGC